MEHHPWWILFIGLIIGAILGWSGRDRVPDVRYHTARVLMGLGVIAVLGVIIWISMHGLPDLHGALKPSPSVPRH